MFNDLSESAAEDRASPQGTARRSRRIAFVELITTAALALSTAVAITAVSIGMARAEVAGAVVRGEVASVTIALIVALLLSGMGGLSAVMAAQRARLE